MPTPERWSRAEIPDLSGRTAVVTGANSGIGFETARALAGRGARVILACRSAEKGAAAAGRIRDEHPKAEAPFEVLDLADLASIRAFAEKFAAEEAALHLLCNNAGIMMVPSGRTADGFEAQFGTNHLGHFALTGLLLDRIRSAVKARVVTLSSLYHRMGGIDFDDLHAERSYSRSGAYRQSKLANLLFARELERRFERAGIDAISVAAHPGWTATNLQQHSPLFRLLNPLLAQKPPDGALPTLYAATAPGVKGGEYFGPSGWLELRGAPTRARSSRRSRSESTAARLWEVSERLTGVVYGI